MAKVIALCLLLAGPAFCLDQTSPLKNGNALYAEGKFGESVQAYEAALQAGQKNWALEYNLANAYYRQNQLGKAILHYERAFRLNPGQSDVIYNLDLASSRAGEPRLPESALVLLFWRLFYALSINALTLLTSLLFLLITADLALRLVGRSTVKVEYLTLAGLIFIGSAAWLASRIYILENPEGVVVSSIAEVRSGPSTTYPANFTVPEGHRVILLKEQESVQGWHQIGVPREGLRGWVPETSVEII